MIEDIGAVWPQDAHTKAQESISSFFPTKEEGIFGAHTALETDYTRITVAQ